MFWMFLLGCWVGLMLGIFLTSLLVAAKEADEEMEEAPWNI